MARLPDLITDGIYVKWPEEEEWARRNENFFSCMGQMARKAIAESKEKEKGDKNKSD